MNIERVILALAVTCMFLPTVMVFGETSAIKAFQDVTAEAGVGNIGRNRGAAFGDYDGDGDLDIYIVKTGANILYGNNGNGTFSDVSKKAGVPHAGSGMDSVFFDYDNDGDLDLYVANWGANVLYQNNGKGAFSDVTRKAGVGDTGNAWSVVVLDYDMDGWLDIYIGNGGGMGTNILYHNEQDGTFLDTTRSAGVGDASDSIGVCVADYDNDGDPDIYVGNWGGGGKPNQGQPDRLYRNEGNGKFKDVAREAGVDDRRQPNATIFLDYDNDGNMDVFLANEVEEDVLYRNNGNGTFTDVSEKAGIEGVRTGFGAMAADYDNDGDTDIYVVNVGENTFYENNGNGTFREIAEDLDIVGGVEGQGAAMADYNKDGYLDLYVVNGFRVDQANVLYQNVLHENNWLHIRLRGVKSNRNGIGARINIRSGILQQIREIIGGTGYASQNTLFAEFGLGKNRRIESVRIQWPSGQVDVLTNILANQAIEVEEGRSGYQTLYVGRNFAVEPERKYITTLGQIKNTALYQNYPNPFNPDTWIPYSLAEDSPVMIKIYSTQGKLARVLELGERAAGVYVTRDAAAHWDGCNALGEPVASGAYFYTLQVGDFTATKKLVIMR